MSRDATARYPGTVAYERALGGRLLCSKQTTRRDSRLAAGRQPKACVRESRFRAALT